MMIQNELTRMMERLKTERDELRVKVHLASMEVKEEFAAAEKNWQELKQKATEVATDAAEVSDEYVDKAKIVGEELREAYRRIGERLRK